VLALLLFVCLAVFAGFLFVVKAAATTVVSNEYSWWGRYLGDLLIRLAVRLQPRSRRDLRRSEWFAEVDQVREDDNHAALLFCIRVLLGAPATALADRRTESEEHTDDPRSGVIGPIRLVYLHNGQRVTSVIGSPMDAQWLHQHQVAIEVRDQEDDPLNSGE
jgi:hypothetical protein